MDSLKYFITILIVFSLVLLNPSANAQSKNIFSVESNIQLIPLHGYSFNFYIKPYFSNKIKLGAGMYSFTSRTVSLSIPVIGDYLVIGLNNEKIRIVNTPCIQVEYYPLMINKKWFIGEQLSFLNYQLFLEDEDRWSGKLRKTSWMTYAGYSYKLPKLPLYLKAWAGLGFIKPPGYHKNYNENYKYQTLLLYMTGINGCFVF